MKEAANSKTPGLASELEIDPSGPGANATAGPVGAHWTTRRIELLRWLEIKAPALAPVYLAAVEMAINNGFPGRVWFVAHALREIRNRLPDALAGVSTGSRTEYSQLAEEVNRCWIEDGLPADGSSPFLETQDPGASGPVRHEISQSLLLAVSRLVAGHVAIGPRKHENAARMFHAVSGGPVPDYVIVTWLKATDRAMRFAHLRNKPLEPEEERKFDEVFAACEEALIAIATRSYENMEDLDEILGSANS